MGNYIAINAIEALRIFGVLAYLIQVDIQALSRNFLVHIGDSYKCWYHE